MNTFLQEAVDISYREFQTWDEAAAFYVQKIFSFSEQCGHKSIIETINDIHTYTLDNDFIIPLSYLNYTGYSQYIEYLKSLINYYIESEMQSIDPVKIAGIYPEIKVEQSVQTHQTFFLMASHCAIRLFKELLEDPEYSRLINTSLNPSLITTTVIRKQNDYGPENISKFGMWGLIVRLHDKIARFENLMSSKRKATNAVSDETVYDTLLDIVGYSTVALLWTNGWFLLPLKKDI